MSRKSIIHINNRHRSSSTSSPNSFSVNLGTSTVTQEVSAVRVKSVSFTNTQYNITSRSNTFYYSDDLATVKSVTIPIGQYNITDLITALTASLLVAGVTVIMALDPLTQKIQVVSTAPAIQYFDFEYGQDNILGAKLGIGGKSGLEGGAFNFLNVPDLTGLTMLYVRSSAISNDHSLEQFTRAPPTGNDRLIRIEMSDIIEAVGVSAPFGFFIHYENDNPLNIIEYETPRSMSNIDIELTDNFGDIVELNGGEVIIVLEVDH